MGCLYNFHFCCRQDRRAFKRAQLRAGSSDTDLQTQIPNNQSRTSALAGREEGITLTCSFPLVCTGCVKPVLSSSGLSRINRTVVYHSRFWCIETCLMSYSTEYKKKDGRGGKLDLENDPTNSCFVPRNRLVEELVHLATCIPAGQISFQ